MRRSLSAAVSRANGRLYGIWVQRRYNGRGRRAHGVLTHVLALTHDGIARLVDDPLVRWTTKDSERVHDRLTRVHLVPCAIESCWEATLYGSDLCPEHHQAIRGKR